MQLSVGLKVSTQANLFSSRHQFDCFVTTFVCEAFKLATNHIQSKSKVSKKITQNCSRFRNKSLLSKYKTVIHFYTVTVSSFNPHQHLTHKHAHFQNNIHVYYDTTADVG